jgi:hypothetical protein
MAYHHQYSAETDPAFRSQRHMCPTCLKNVSVDHPVIVNLENCTCADAKFSVRQSGHVDKIQDPFINSPVSNAPSRDESVRTPPYGVDPGDRFLPIAPAIGLGELQHRRRAEFDAVEEELSYSLRRWISSPSALDQEYHIQSWQNDGTWFRLDPFLLPPSSRATGGSLARHSRSHSRQSGSLKSNASGWMSTRLDPLISTGGWMIDEDQPGWLCEIIDEDGLAGEDHAAHLAALQDREEHEGLIAQRNLLLNLNSSELEDKKGRLHSLIGNPKLIYEGQIGCQMILLYCPLAISRQIL